MFGNLFFFIRECGLNLRRQGLMAVACVGTAAVSLAILGVFAILASQAYAIAEASPRQFEVHAFTRVDTPRERTEALKREIQALPGVAAVRVVPREQAWSEFRARSAHRDVLDGFTENPLPDKLEIVPAAPDHTLAIARS